MALNFPSSPNTNATYSFSGKTWTYNGNAWALTSNTLNTSIVPEGSNLYFSNDRVYSNVVTLGYATNSNVALKANVIDLTTANVTEVTNLYYSNARARASITVSGSGTYDPNTGIITINQSSNYGDSNVALLGYATNANVALKANVLDLTTANVAELTNLYFTSARARTAISVSGSGSYNNTTGVITVTGDVTSVNGQTGATTGFATTANSLAQFASTTSAQLATLISDETGTGNVVFSNSPTFTGTVAAANVALSGDLTVTGGNISGVLVATNGIVVNSQTVATSYTIAAGFSGMSAGPITVASGQAVTVSSGSRWVVL